MNLTYLEKYSIIIYPKIDFFFYDLLLNQLHLFNFLNQFFLISLYQIDNVTSL